MGRNLLKEPVGAHRMAALGGLGPGQRDVPPGLAARPFLAGPMTRERARDVECPALVDDRDGLAMVADRRGPSGPPATHRLAPPAAEEGPRRRGWVLTQTGERQPPAPP